MHEFTGSYFCSFPYLEKMLNCNELIYSFHYLHTEIKNVGE